MSGSNSKAIMAASAAVLSWSTVAAAFKTALRYFSHFEMLVVAALTATLIFFIASLFNGSMARIRSLSRRDWLQLLMLGIFSPTLYYLVLFAAYDKLPAQVAQPINYCWPIFLVLLLAVVQHKPVRPRLYIGMAASLAGVAVISLGAGGISGESLSVVGVILAFLSAVLWAVYWILNDRMSASIPESLKLFTSFLFASVILCGATLFVPCSFDSVPGVLASCYVGAFEMGIPFLFFSMALRYAVNVAIVNQMCYIAPFLSLFFISVIVGERIMPLTYLGLVLIIGGVVYNQYLAYRPGRKLGKA